MFQKRIRHSQTVNAECQVRGNGVWHTKQQPSASMRRYKARQG